MFTGHKRVLDTLRQTTHDPPVAGEKQLSAQCEKAPALLGLAALLLLLRFRADAVWLILGGAALGLVHLLSLGT